MKRVILKPNLDNDLTTALLDDMKDKIKISVYNYLSDIDELKEANLLAGIASKYFRTNCYCLEMDEKTLTIFGLKYADCVQKILPDEIEPELLLKCRSFLKMSRHINELANALSELQSAESELADDYEEITGNGTHLYNFSDYDVDEYRDYYSLDNSSIKEVFKEILE